MLFNSLAYAFFFPAVLICYWSVRNHLKTQNFVLLASSCLFYGWWDWRFLGLMAITIIVDYQVSKALARTPEGLPEHRKRLVMTSVIVNLSILGWFKYFGFFVDSLLAATASVGLDLNRPLLEIVLPVGISFYTFQSLSYVVDVYRGRIAPAQSLLNYSSYVTLFPQLVAGPIERGAHLLPQIERHRKITAEQFYSGSYLILWGLFKKIYIADNLSRYVDPVFDGDLPTSGLAVMLATYAFAFQIYCDFSAYSDIARGSARCMGFDLMRNFRLPYFSRNPQEFWNRWHISLSTWLRDYLYISLGGNRHGNLQTYRNLLITMILGGLWHGAQANFVLWGCYQGILLVVHRYAAELLNARRGATNSMREQRSFDWRDAIKIAVFFHFACYGWLLFRASSLEQIIVMSQTLTRFPTDVYTALQEASDYARILVYVAPLIAVQLLQARTGRMDAVLLLPTAARVVLYVMFVVLMITLGALGDEGFIYFQF